MARSGTGGTPLHLQVGAPDPERDTSPIVDEEAEEEVEPNVAGHVCYFNGVTFPIGEYVLSGSEVLRCEAPGVWVREGELQPRPGEDR
jgi:hypothetical protein